PLGHHRWTPLDYRHRSPPLPRHIGEFWEALRAHAVQGAATWRGSPHEGRFGTSSEEGSEPMSTLFDEVGAHGTEHADADSGDPPRARGGLDLQGRRRTRDRASGGPPAGAIGSRADPREEYRSGGLLRLLHFLGGAR